MYKSCMYIIAFPLEQSCQIATYIDLSGLLEICK